MHFFTEEYIFGREKYRQCKLREVAQLKQLLFYWVI